MIDCVDGRHFGDIRILFPVTPGASVAACLSLPSRGRVRRRPGESEGRRTVLLRHLPPRMVAPMSTSISENRHRAFEPLTGGEASNFCLFARYVELELRIDHTLSPSRVPLPQPTGIPL